MQTPFALQEGSERELLQQQLQEANRRAQEYRHQLLKKEQEAEQYRLRLEAMARQQPNGVDFTVVEEVAEVDAVVVTEGEDWVLNDQHICCGDRIFGAEGESSVKIPRVHCQWNRIARCS